MQRVGSDELVDLDAGRRLPWPARGDMAIRVLDPDTAWNTEGFLELRSWVRELGEPPSAEILLADARFLIGAAEPRDPSRALLIAAVACEVKIKTLLRQLSTPEQEPLIGLLLESPRDWLMAASALFDKPLRIITGRSLKDADRQLFTRIVQLFERRNALAHRGHIPTTNEALDSV